ncbi:hypothetical protein KJ673_04445 [Patescibacteria group bacterium]|nr:hypothetical protein [Patescibacteria group bacterium]
MKRDIRELLRRVQMDFDMRTSGKYDEQIDRDNIKFLRIFVDKYGWPKSSEYSEQVVNGAWLLAQHGGFDVDLQKHCLKLMKELVDINEVCLEHIAYLEDRIRVIEDRKQLYGTQLTLKDGRLVPKPIYNQSKVDDRRANFKLGSLDDYIQVMNENYKKNR